MRSAKDVPLNDVIDAVQKVIDRIMQGIPEGSPRAGYRTDHADDVTGYRGVVVYMYTAPGRGSLNLVVQGPEMMVQEMVKRYGRDYRTWGRATGKVLFEIRS